jgi:uncharacterized protein YbjT (DUF2867 family)
MSTILLTGATGFVGRYLYPALVAAGHEVRCATRDVARARDALPGRPWVSFDLDRPDTLAPAMADCDAAYFLVHSIGDAGGDYPTRELRGAEAFVDAAAAAGVRRLIYLGGVAPRGDASRHLASRLHVGEVLRAGPVATIELRAAMIIGVGSASWTMVRDLSRRLPAMLLPRWLANHSHPVAIDDVIVALVAALDVPGDESRWFELPGPERVSHREMLRRTSTALGRRRVMLSVPVLSPRLSSYWIALVTRTDLAMARELVEGVRSDLDPIGQPLWPTIGHRPMPLDEAIRRTLLDEADDQVPSREARRRLEVIGHRGHAAPA